MIDRLMLRAQPSVPECRSEVRAGEHGAHRTAALEELPRWSPRCSEPLPGPRILICKTGAAGDVLRTTSLLEAIPQYHVDWLVTPKNAALLSGTRARVFTHVEQINPLQRYDVFLSLEESLNLATALAHRVWAELVVGVYPADSGRVAYTDASQSWFNMSLISRFGREAANRLKFENRLTYQEHLFAMLGLPFRGEAYVCIRDTPGWPRRNVLLAPQAGSRWPNKRWAFYAELAEQLSTEHRVTWLDHQPTYHHLAGTIAAHCVLVANDSLPMHLGLSERVPTIGLFTCTSPWEIHDYGLLTKISSPRLWDFYYSTHTSDAAASSISVNEVAATVTDLLAAVGDTVKTYPQSL